MSNVWYGSINNRLDENKMFCDEIKVGTLMTEYYYSDRHPYEVVEVTDQKHVKVRAMDHEHVGNIEMDNNWKLVSNENNTVQEMVKRGDYWYFAQTVYANILENDDVDTKLYLAMNGIDVEKLKKNGKVTKYNRANVSFGVGEYYYDYEF